MIKKIGLFVFCLPYAMNVYSQSSLPENTDFANASLDVVATALNQPGNGDWIYYQDPVNKLLNIDFSKLGGRMSRLCIRNKSDQSVVLKEDLFDIPADAIYALDLSRLIPGEYLLELFSLKDKHTEELIIR